MLYRSEVMNYMIDCLGYSENDEVFELSPLYRVYETLTETQQIECHEYNNKQVPKHLLIAS